MSYEKESNKAPGFGVDYKKVVSTRSDKIGGHGDLPMKETVAAFKAACNDTKKA
jgi:hypothetical protein